MLVVKVIYNLVNWMVLIDDLFLESCISSKLQKTTKFLSKINAFFRTF